MICAEPRVAGDDLACRSGRQTGLIRRVTFPRPGVAEPELRQDVQWSRIRPAVMGRDEEQDVRRPRFGVFDEHVKVSILIEHTRVEQLVFRLLPATLAILINQLGIRELALRLLVKQLQV